MSKSFYFWVFLILFNCFSCRNRLNNKSHEYSKQWIHFLRSTVESNKYTLVEFYTDWCAPCHMLRKDVLENDTIVQFLNRDIQFLSVNAEKGIGLRMAMKYSITKYPTLLLFNKAGMLIDEKVGTEDIGKPSSFLRYWEPYFKQPKTTLPANGLTKTINVNKYPEFYVKYFTSGETPDSCTIKRYLGNQTNLFSEVNWAVIRVFGKYKKTRNFVTKNANRYINLYGPMVQNMVKGSLRKSIINDYINKDSSQFKKDISAYVRLLRNKTKEEKIKKRVTEELFYWAKTGLSWKNYSRAWMNYRKKYGNDLDVKAAKIIEEHTDNLYMIHFAARILDERSNLKDKGWKELVGFANLLEKQRALRNSMQTREYLSSISSITRDSPDPDSLYNLAIEANRDNDHIISRIVYSRIQGAFFIPDDKTWAETMNFYNKYLPRGYKGAYIGTTIDYYAKQKKWDKFIPAVYQLAKRKGGFKNIHEGDNVIIFDSYIKRVLKSVKDTMKIKAALDWTNKIIKYNKHSSKITIFKEDRRRLKQKLKDPSATFSYPFLN